MPRKHISCRNPDVMNFGRHCFLKDHFLSVESWIICRLEAYSEFLLETVICPYCKTMSSGCEVKEKLLLSAFFSIWIQMLCHLLSVKHKLGSVAGCISENIEAVIRHFEFSVHQVIRERSHLKADLIL